MCYAIFNMVCILSDVNKIDPNFDLSFFPNT